MYLKRTSSSLTFKVHVQPRSSKNMLAGQYGDALKIKLTAPPVHGAANKMCIQFLSKQLQIPKSSIEIVSGLKHRTKQIVCRVETASDSEETIRKLKKSIQSLANR